MDYDRGLCNFAPVMSRLDSLYTSSEKILWFRNKVKLFSSGREEDVIIEPCRKGEKVCILLPDGVPSHIFYTYSHVLEDLNVKIPFTDFECEILKFLNVAPTQIHPNSWAFIRGFEILAKGKGFEPTVGEFCSFYRTKGVDEGTWVSITAHPDKGFFLSFVLTINLGKRVSFAYEAVHVVMSFVWARTVHANFPFIGTVSPPL
jgi:hypothetical protein